MKKSLMSRIIGLAALYCLVFCLLVVLQFSNMGNFSVSTGAMTIRGRYLKTSGQTKQEGEEIAGGIKIFYGGLEFMLKEERGKGFMMTNINGINTPVNPQMMLTASNSVCFTLPGGTTLIFTPVDSANGQELHINAEFEDNISEVTIPVVLRRSSLVMDSGQLGVMYSGSRYVFSSLGQELENGYLTLSKDNTFISYRSRGKQRAFNPSDYIIAQAANYDTVLRNWENTIFTQWNQNPASLQYEDDIIAYSAQALLRGNYTQATGAISRDFINSPRQSYRSAGFVGGMTGAYNSFSFYENERINLITRLIRERSLNILKEEHILDFLFTRSNPVLANEVIEMINNASPDMITFDHCPGLLEVYYDIGRWRPEVNNLIERLTEQMLLLISDNLYRDNENDSVYVSSSETNNSEYSIRLGKALVYWADTVKNTDWSAIGRSLVLSAIANGNAGRLHNILNPTEYYPRAAWLTNEGHWTWTVSPTVRASYTDINLNISVSFPVNMAHYMIIRGIRPFIGIQIHGQDWRTDSQFERYDSSGWIYYPTDQILVMKLRHRVTTESVRIIYRAAAPVPLIEEGAETNTGAVVD